MDEIKKLRLFSIQRCARTLGVGRDTVKRWMDEGRIRFIKDGKRRLIPQVELVRFSEEGLVKTQILKPKEEPEMQIEKRAASHYPHISKTFAQGLLEKIIRN